MAKPVKSKLKLGSTISPMWVVGAVLLVGIVGWMMVGRSTTPVGINQVVESSNLLEVWDFDVATDMGKETGWYALQPVNYDPASLGSTTPADIRNSGNVATSLVDGMMTFPTRVNSDISLINSAMSLAIPEASKDLQVLVVATGVSKKPNKPSTPPGVQLPEIAMKGQLKVGQGPGPASVTKSTKVEIGDNYLVYTFRVTAEELSRMKMARALPIKKMELTLTLGGFVIEGLKIDKIKVLLVDPPPAPSTGPATTTVTGTLRVSGRGTSAKCVISTAANGDYQVVYTGPSSSPTASVVKGCPAELAPFVSENVTATGTLLGGAKILRIKSLSDILVN